MRSLVLGAAILGVTPASAQPSPATDAAPTGYLELAPVAGLGLTLYAAASVEGGYHVGHGLWLHGAFQLGNLVEIAFSSQEGSDCVVTDTGYRMVRGGVEERLCTRGGGLCGIVGADAGYLREYQISVANPRDVRAAVIVPRVALDIGGGQLRFRPGIEAGFSRSGIETLGLTGGVAFVF